MKYIPALDGIRGIAILLVILFHFGLLGMGWMGVEVFFVLSGFLITRILSRGKTWPLGFYLKRFYWRRTLRIFPLYFGFLLLVTIVYLLTHRPPGGGDLLPYLYTYTFNFWMISADWTQNMLLHYLWSLSFEEQFYLVWPLLVFLLPRRGMMMLCIGILLCSPVIRYFLAEYLAAARGTRDMVGGMVYYLPFGQVDTFATGALLAVWGLEKKVHKPLRIFLPMFGLFVGVGLVNAILVSKSISHYILSNFGYPVSSLLNGQHIWGYTLINLTAAALILVAIHPDVKAGGMLRKILEMKWLTWIGRISYGVYILHWPIQFFLEKLVDVPYDSALRYLVFFPYLALVLGTAWLSFRFYESWFLKQKSRKWNTPPANPTEE